MSSSGMRTSLVLLIAMLAAAGLTIAATPYQRMADVGPKVDLDTMVPETFGEWTIDNTIVPVLVAPEVQQKLDKIYNQTLARTYVNRSGERVMLSIAYGGDQSDAMRAHRPEVCYTAQGFHIARTALDQLVTEYGVLPVKRLVAIAGRRNEPITYWMVVGEHIAHDSLSQKLAQLRYGLTGTIPDGILVRVSTIDRNNDRAFEIQDRFVKGLLDVMPSNQRLRLSGTFQGNAALQ